MKLLITTQVVDKNDPILGFFHRWIEEFAKHCESVEVICLYEGEHSLPENVHVYSLGKEKGARSSLSYSLTFISLAWKLRRKYDHVFVHMNPEYLVLMGFWWWLWRKPAALWYMHKHVSWRLAVGVFFAGVVYTASPKSMRMKTSKKRVVGHGVDLAAVKTFPAPAFDGTLSLLTVGRLSPVKRVDVLIRTMGILQERGVSAELTIVGGNAGKGAAAEKNAEEYASSLRELAEKQGSKITFAGPIPHAKLGEYFSRVHLFLHASDTGSLDKASLEPLAAGIPIITADDELASANIPAIILAKPTPESFADAIQHALEERVWTNESVRTGAREYVEKNHELQRLITRILAYT